MNIVKIMSTSLYKMFKKWCSDQGFTTPQSKPSHVLMDGGVLKVPFDRLNDFYKVYVQCIKSGEHLFVVEQKTDVYNFFLDVDYKSNDALELDDIRMIAIDVCAMVESLGLPPRCIVSVARPKKKDNQLKTGVHFNWPDLPVNQEGALHLMYHIISTLNISRNDDWSQYIDRSVYGDPNTGTNGSGFRMPWSHKKGKHVECGGQGCMVCNMTGKLTEGEYLPIFEFGDTLKECSQDPTVEGLWSVTVRTEANPIEVPRAATIFVPKKKEGSFTAAQTKNRLNNMEVEAHLETFIRRYMTGQAHTRVKKIYKNKKKYMIETTSKFCENLGRMHNSNHVWFLISEDFIIVQKCFCRCETMAGRKCGFCKDFAGRPHKLSTNIINLLKQ